MVCALSATGVQFLFNLYSQGLGGILADDMVSTPCPAMKGSDASSRRVSGEDSEFSAEAFEPLGPSRCGPVSLRLPLAANALLGLRMEADIPSSRLSVRKHS